MLVTRQASTYMHSVLGGATSLASFTTALLYAVYRKLSSGWAYISILRVVDFDVPANALITLAGGSKHSNTLKSHRRRASATISHECK